MGRLKNNIPRYIEILEMKSKELIDKISKNPPNKEVLQMELKDIIKQIQCSRELEQTYH